MGNLPFNRELQNISTGGSKNSGLAYTVECRYTLYLAFILHFTLSSTYMSNNSFIEIGVRCYYYALIMYAKRSTICI